MRYKDLQWTARIASTGPKNLRENVWSGVARSRACSNSLWVDSQSVNRPASEETAQPLQAPCEDARILQFQFLRQGEVFTADETRGEPKRNTRAIKAPELSASAKGLLPCITILPGNRNETFLMCLRLTSTSPPPVMALIAPTTADTGYFVGPFSVSPTRIRR